MASMTNEQIEGISYNVIR